MTVASKAPLGRNVVAFNEEQLIFVAERVRQSERQIEQASRAGAVGALRQRSRAY